MPWPEDFEYPQMPSLTDEELVAFLDQVMMARLGTLNEDGTIHITPVYFKHVDGQIMIATQDISRKVKNIKRHKDVSVLVDVTPWPFKAVLIYGTAELDYEDVIAKRIAIFERNRPREEAQSYAQALSKQWKCVIQHALSHSITPRANGIEKHQSGLCWSKTTFRTRIEQSQT